MNLKVLSDNSAFDEYLESEHGLSVYLETKQYKFLLDTGASEKFIHNAEKLDIDISDIDYVFISHGHADHIGGLESFLKLNSKAKIIISKKALTQRFFSTRNGQKEIGISFDVDNYLNRFLFVDEKMEIEKDIMVFSCKSSPFSLPKANKTLYKISGRDFVPDNFDHELVISFGFEDLFIYSGCAHKGILNILNHVMIDIKKPVSHLIGGFHMLDSYDLLQYETDDEIAEIGDYLRENYPQTVFITGHCTGGNVYNKLKIKLQEKLIHFYTGFNIYIHY